LVYPNTHSTAWLEADLDPFRGRRIAAFGDGFDRDEDIRLWEIGGEISFGNVIGDDLPGI